MKTMRIGSSIIHLDVMYDINCDEGIVRVEFVDGSTTGFMCGSPEVRDRYLAEIEEVFCPKKLFNQIEEEV